MKTPPDSIVTIDCHYDAPGKAAAYLIVEGGRATFVDNNTARALPHLLGALESRGLRPEAVDYVIITHVHLDHAGGSAALMEACPNATLLAHAKAARHISDPARLIAGTRAVYGDTRFERLYGEILPVDAARVRVMADGETLGWGSRTLRFFHTLGHASHHFCIHDSGANAVFTGDALGIGRSSYVRPGNSYLVCSSSPADFDGPEAHLSADRIVETGAEWAYAGHFGPFDGLPERAHALHRSIAQHEEILAQAWEQNLDGPALVAFCTERVSAAMLEFLQWAQVDDPAAELEWLANDIPLNGQGLAAVIERQRKHSAK